MTSLSLFLLFPFLTLSFGAIGGLIGRTQSAAVRGLLMCNDEPATGVVVKLFDDDRGIDSDDLMDVSKTNRNGTFFLSGYTKEITSIDPKLNIYHDCNDGPKPCQRKFTIFIPDSYISSGKNPHKTYDAGTIQLAGQFPKEERDCVH